MTSNSQADVEEEEQNWMRGYERVVVKSERVKEVSQVIVLSSAHQSLKRRMGRKMAIKLTDAQQE